MKDKFSGVISVFKIFFISLLTAFLSLQVQARVNSCSRLFDQQVFNQQTSAVKGNNSILDWNHEGGLFPDISKLNPRDLIEAQDQSIAEVRAIIKEIKTIKNPTFENVIHPLEFADQKNKKFDNLYGLLDSSFKGAELKKIEKDILIKANEFENEVWTDPILFEKINAIYMNKNSLSIPQQRLIDDYHRRFIINGLNLKGEKQKRFLEIKQELIQLETQFSNNSIESLSSFRFLVTNKNDLIGLPESLIDLLQSRAKASGKNGYLLTLEPAVYLGVMKYSENPDLRKKLYEARGKIAYQTGKTDNSQVIIQIAKLRNEMAQILGYKHYSEYALGNKMARNIETVRELLNKLIEVYKPQAIREEQELKDFVKSKTGSDILEAWDRSYWVEKLLQEKYEFDESIISEYLEYNQVQKAAFTVAGKLYGLKFIERSDLPKFDTNTQVFEVRNHDERLMAYFIVDPFARGGLKSSGAWASRLFPTYKFNDQRQIPIVTNTMNFSKVENGKPQLLTVDEAITLFHEFGHALHTILSEAEYPSQSGTAVARDFVELPSQFFENFFYEKEVLNMFAYNYKTNELLPEQYIESIKRIKQFRSATAALRQVGLSLIDLAWHDGSALSMGNTIYEIEKNILKPVMITQSTVDTVISTNFSHIFSGGYSSSYYSYKWAEILDADAFSIFKKEGLFNPQTAKRFLVILQSGGSFDPQELYRNFSGRDPSPDAMFRRDGVSRGRNSSN